jgi:hypothetical protein
MKEIYLVAAKTKKLVNNKLKCHKYVRSFVFEEKKRLSRDLSLVGRVWPNKQFIMVEQ